MRKYSERGFKNLEFLRFLLIWAVVGVHIAYLNLSGAEQFSWLVKWTSGWQAVEMFFLMSGFSVNTTPITRLSSLSVKASIS